MFVQHPVEITVGDKESIIELTAAEGLEVEPLAHQLLHEAEEQIVNNSRSALIMAVAAAEVGLKSLIVQKLPETEWLIVKFAFPLLRRLQLSMFNS